MLELDAVTVRFGGLVALRDVTFSVAPGEILGLVGPNGAGKTTLFNGISGLTRVRGRIRFEGRDITKLPLYRRGPPRHRPHLPDPAADAAPDRAGEPRRRQVFGAGRHDPARIEEILSVMELQAQGDRPAESAPRPAGTEAPGDRQGARHRAPPPPPRRGAGRLESQAKRQFAAKLKELHQRFGLTIVIVEHDIETISDLCSRRWC